MSFDDSAVIKGFNCIWRVENVTIPNVYQEFSLKSPKFKVNCLNNVRCHLEIHQGREDSITIHLFQDEGIIDSGIKFSLCFLSHKKWIPLLKNEKRLIFPQFLERNILTTIPNVSYYFPGNGMLTLNLTMHKRKEKIICSQCFMRSRLVNGSLIHSPVQEYQFLKQSDFINFSNPVVLNSGDTVSISSFQQREKTLNNFEELIEFFRENRFQFVTLRTPEKEFAIHKALLCAKSPVFKAMFEKEMKEAQSNVVDINDIDNNSLSLLLQFLHSEPPKYLDWDEAKQLYYASEKYQILQLRDICSSFLKKNLSNANICEAIVLADLYEDEELNSCAQKYFCENSKAILLSPEWKDLMMKKTELAFHTLRALADKL